MSSHALCSGKVRHIDCFRRPTIIRPHQLVRGVMKSEKHDQETSEGGLPVPVTLC